MPKITLTNPVIAQALSGWDVTAIHLYASGDCAIDLVAVDANGDHVPGTAFSAYATDTGVRWPGGFVRTVGNAANRLRTLWLFDGKSTQTIKALARLGILGDASNVVETLPVDADLAAVVE